MLYELTKKINYRGKTLQVGDKIELNSDEVLDFSKKKLINKYKKLATVKKEKVEVKKTPSEPKEETSGKQDIS